MKSRAQSITIHKSQVWARLTLASPLKEAYRSITVHIIILSSLFHYLVLLVSRSAITPKRNALVYRRGALVLNIALCKRFLNQWSFHRLTVRGLVQGQSSVAYCSNKVFQGLQYLILALSLSLSQHEALSEFIDPPPLRVNRLCCRRLSGGTTGWQPNRHAH